VSDKASGSDTKYLEHLAFAKLSLIRWEGKRVPFISNAPPVGCLLLRFSMKFSNKKIENGLRTGEWNRFIDCFSRKARKLIIKHICLPIFNPIGELKGLSCDVKLFKKFAIADDFLQKRATPTHAVEQI
jgi:hypothetical protein